MQHHNRCVNRKVIGTLQFKLVAIELSVGAMQQWWRMIPQPQGTFSTSLLRDAL
jgi:hypothetical protein